MRIDSREAIQRLSLYPSQLLKKSSSRIYLEQIPWEIAPSVEPLKVSDEI